MNFDNAPRSGMSINYPVFAYNAVKLSPSEVAQSFVDPPSFRRLVRADNALLVGPRGSGKTTLLKMLQSEALENWTDPRAAEVRSEARSVGVFIGVDRMWSEQLNQLGANSPSFGHAAYSLQIARSLCNAMIHRVEGPLPAEGGGHLRIDMSVQQQSLIAAEFAGLFNLKYMTTTLRATKQQIQSRVVELGAFRHKTGVETLPDWAFIDPMGAVAALAETFNDVAADPGRKWSMLFDELELAPIQMVQDLMGRLRGAEERLNYKLSLSPVHSQIDLLRGELGAVAGQDVEHISLSEMSRRSSMRFTQRLLQAHLDHKTPPIRSSPYRLLGPSAFDATEAPSEAEGTASRRTVAAHHNPYAIGGRVWKDMAYLEGTDLSFKSYLRKHQIDLESLSDLSPLERAAKLRKVRNLVVVRAFYKKNGRRRSRKSLELYTGANSLLTITDGNPRMSIALIKELVRDMQDDRQVGIVIQSDAVGFVVDRFSALLRAQESVTLDDRSVSLVTLTDQIGESMARRVLDDDFRADAPAAFDVDDDVDERLMPLIEQAVNTGAFVQLSSTHSDQSAISDTVRGRRYRLTYLLAPKYGLPLRLGKAVPMSGLIEDRSTSLVTHNQEGVLQPPLPGL